MAELYLECRDKRFNRREWVLTLLKDGVKLHDCDDKLRAEFSHADAEGRFTFPSFWMSVKDLGVIDDDGETIWFAPDRESIGEIKKYFSAALAAQGPDVIQDRRIKARLQLAGGCGLMLLAVVIVVVLSMIVDRPRPVIYGGLVVVIAGAKLIHGGITSLFRTSRAEKELDRLE
jgi:hypothetical protein